MLNSLWSGFVGLALMLAVMLALAPVGVASDRPLVVEGKSSVFQRILTRPGAVLHSAPAGDAINPLVPLKPFYVYAREGEWVQVGTSAVTGAQGWIRDAETVHWPHNIVASFTEPVGRNRQVLFDTWQGLRQLMTREDLVELQAELLRAADTGDRVPNWTTVAVEPENYVDIRDRFYIMPILNFREDLHASDYSPILFMQIASLPLKAGGEDPEPGSAVIDNFDVGVMIVMDTTTSMDPYIRGTRDAVARLVGLIGESEISDRVHFGAVGFRDDPTAVAALEYRTKVIAGFDRDRSPQEFLAALDATETAQASSIGFNEDSFAGVYAAINETNWAPQEREFGGKYIILITDAGPKQPSGAADGTDLGASELQTLANEQGIAILTLHLQTEAGEANHQYAEGIYRELSKFQDRTYYYPIERGEPAAFEAKIGDLFTAFQGHVVATIPGEQEPPESEDDALADLGLAMRLRFLGDQHGTEVPEIISGWVTDNAIERPTRRAVEPRLLVTRNELSTMTTVLERLIEAAERSQGDNEPGTLFRQIRDAVSQMANDPQLVVNTDFETLGGAVGEFLEGLPYNSQIMDITEDMWLNMGTERRVIIDSLRQKLELYRQFHNNPDNWTSLSVDDPDGEQVYAMPFSTLP